MDPNAIARARERLLLAEDALARIKAERSFKGFSGQWYQLLVAAKNVYTQLEQGAKTSPQSAQWFGARKQERRNDPLLQYLFQARDADEHGIADTTKRANAAIGIGGVGQTLLLNGTLIDEDGFLNSSVISSTDGQPVHYEFLPERMILLPVVGRGNVTFYPPGTHKGKRIADASAIGVATLGLAHLSALVREAEKLA